MRNGDQEQTRILGWQVRAAFASGVAGTFVFAWTDEWFTGGHLIEDWAFGLVDRRRQPKPAFYEVAARYKGVLPPPLPRYPQVSVVVCSYNAERTMEACLASLGALDYPDYEVIVVNDGSTDRTLENRRAISVLPDHQPAQQGSERRAQRWRRGGDRRDRRLYRQRLRGRSRLADLPRREDGGEQSRGLRWAEFPASRGQPVPAAVAVSPGGPTHVLISDEVAEHIAGCNMAFRRDALMALGGFDPVYRAAGDDVDICWRFQDAGHAIGFSPAAIVWHFRRNTVRAYLKQQRGYGKAEALVYAKHPFRFKPVRASEMARPDLWRPVGRAPLVTQAGDLFRGIRARPVPDHVRAALLADFAAALDLRVEPRGLAAGAGRDYRRWLVLAPDGAALATWAMCVNGALKAPIDKRFGGAKARSLVALLIYLGPLLRGWDRLKWRFKTMQTQDHVGLSPVEQRARIDWPARAFTLSYWNEFAGEKEALLAGLMDFLLPQKYFVVPDTGWSKWDLKISRGLWSRAFITVCAENHGGPKRLLRVRCAMRMSSLARALLRACAAVTAAGLILGSPLVAMIFFGARGR